MFKSSLVNTAFACFFSLFLAILIKHSSLPLSKKLNVILKAYFGLKKISKTFVNVKTKLPLAVYYFLNKKFTLRVQS